MEKKCNCNPSKTTGKWKKDGNLLHEPDCRLSDWGCRICKCIKVCECVD